MPEESWSWSRSLESGDMGAGIIALIVVMVVLCCLLIICLPLLLLLGGCCVCCYCVGDGCGNCDDVDDD